MIKAWAFIAVDAENEHDVVIVLSPDSRLDFNIVYSAGSAVLVKALESQ